VNGCDLTLPTKGHTSDQEYDELTASRKGWSTPYSRNTLQNFPLGSYDFSKILSVAFRPESKMQWISSSFGLIMSKYLFSRNWDKLFQGGV